MSEEGQDVDVNFNDGNSPSKNDDSDFAETFHDANGSNHSAQKINSGDVSSHIGVGKYAKTNIIFHVISAIFVVFSCICVSLIILVIYGYKISDITQSIKDIWSVFTPILTLSLGYLFGKRVDKKGQDKVKA